MMTSDDIITAYTALLCVQFAHSLEELSTGFHKKWYAFTMPFAVFLIFELVFLTFWTYVLFAPDLPGRLFLISLFNFLMFANGVQHIIWAGVVKKYVPGLVTAPVFLGVFLWFYL